MTAECRRDVGRMDWVISIVHEDKKSEPNSIDTHAENVTQHGGSASATVH